MKLGKFKEIVLLALVILLSIFLRFYKLGSIPNGLYVDEALTGYNAFSILLTGKDEYGKFLPLAFRFFGSYSPPFYVYLTVVAVKIFGLSIFSTRFFSAAFGVIGVILVYFFLKYSDLFKLKYLPLIGAFLFSISPWAIFFSRAGYEINFGFIVLSLGILFLWLGLRKIKLIPLAYIFLSLSSYGSHLNRYLIPILAALSLVYFKKELFSKAAKRFTTLGLIFAFLIQIPNLYLFLTPAFNTKDDLFYQDLLTTQSSKIHGLLPQFLSYPLSLTREFLARYLTYFSSRSLFLLEDPDIQRSAPGLSSFYFWMVIPYLAGLYELYKERKDSFIKFIIFLLLAFPVPLALTSDPFSFQRGLHMLFPLIVVITIGMGTLFKKYGKIAFLFFILLSLISFIFLWRSYFVLLPFERAKVWGYGFDKLTQEIVNNPKITYVIDQERIKPFYIEFAFFSKLSPEKLQNSVGGKIKENYYTNIVFNSSYKFQNIETRGIEWEKDIYKEQILVGDELTISESQAKEHFLTKVFEIRDPANEIVFIGYKTDPTTKCLRTNFESIYCRKI